MGEGVGHDVALGLTLQAIIADGGGRLHGGLDVAGLEEAPFLLRVVCPYAGQAVGLQLDANLELIGLSLVEALLRLLHLRQDAEQILHVVADLVRDHVGLRELAALASDLAAAETPLDVLKECGVEIDLLVVRTIERSHGGRGIAAGRARGAGEHHQRRRPVGLARPREDLAPLRFGAAEHRRNEFLHLIGRQPRLGRAGRGLRLLRRTAEARQDLGTANEVKRIDAQRPPDEPQENDGAEAETAGAAQAGRPLAALILDPVAARQLIKTHDGTPMLCQRRGGPEKRSNTLSMLSRWRCSTSRPTSKRSPNTAAPTPSSITPS